MSVNINSDNVPKRPFRILSLDGGGVRAVIQAVILARIVKTYPKFLEEVDLFAGTSAGAIVAAALCAGINPDETVGFYESDVAKIFTEGYMKRIISVDNAIGAAYSAEDLKARILKEFGNKTLADLPQKIFIPTFRLDSEEEHTEKKDIRENEQPAKPSCRWTPIFLHNLPNSKTASTPLVDAILRTTAAPTYFPIYQGYVDGGVVANNPALCALTSVLSNSGVNLNDVVVLSISTGSNPKGVHNYGTGNWGLFEWGTKIVELLLDSSTEAIDYQCRCLLNDRYYRLDPFLPKDIPLDDATSLPLLKDIANKVDLVAIEKWIETYWQSSKTDIEMSIEELKFDDNKSTTNGDPNSWRCCIQ